MRWKGMRGEFVIIGIESDALGQEAGIVAPRIDLSHAFAVINELQPKFRPVHIEEGPISATSTGKPQRGQMASGLKIHVGKESTQRMADYLCDHHPFLSRAQKITWIDFDAGLSPRLTDALAEGVILIKEDTAQLHIREEIAATLRQAGASRWGMFILRYGSVDQGSLFWAIK
jgi:hypothetical protein